MSQVNNNQSCIDGEWWLFIKVADSYWTGANIHESYCSGWKLCTFTHVIMHQYHILVLYHTTPYRWVPDSSIELRKQFSRNSCREIWGIYAKNVVPISQKTHFVSSRLMFIMKTMFICYGTQSPQKTQHKCTAWANRSTSSIKVGGTQTS
jgi:hypothetical protein